jgi:hypothetical protein
VDNLRWRDFRVYQTLRYLTPLGPGSIAQLEGYALRPRDVKNLKKLAKLDRVLANRLGISDREIDQQRAEEVQRDPPHESNESSLLSQ